MKEEQFRFLKEICPLTFFEVFEFWMQNEENQEKWQKHAAARGFSSVREWRQRYVKALELDFGTWTLFEILDPLNHVPDFIGGPFNAWVKSSYQGGKGISFREILENPKKESEEAIVKLANNFPKETIMIGLVFQDQIVIIEGMHRCSAIALMAKKQLPFDGVFKIALKRFLGDELPYLESFRKE